MKIIAESIAHNTALFSVSSTFTSLNVLSSVAISASELVPFADVISFSLIRTSSERKICL
jgi:hypothetical protein